MWLTHSCVQTTVPQQFCPPSFVLMVGLHVATDPNLTSATEKHHALEPSWADTCQVSLGPPSRFLCMFTCTYIHDKTPLFFSCLLSPVARLGFLLSNRLRHMLSAYRSGIDLLRLL